MAVTVITAGSFDAYHEPAVCMSGQGYQVAREQLVPLAGPGTAVRALDLASDSHRIYLYHWLQDRKTGAADTGRRMGAYRDALSRLQTAFAALTQGRQTCIVRVMALVPSNDPSPERTRKQVHAVARAVYGKIRESGR